MFQLIPHYRRQAWASDVAGLLSSESVVPVVARARVHARIVEDVAEVGEALAPAEELRAAAPGVVDARADRAGGVVHVDALVSAKEAEDAAPLVVLHLDQTARPAGGRSRCP